jgi:hypothetical protein
MLRGGGGGEAPITHRQQSLGRLNSCAHINTGSTLGQIFKRLVQHDLQHTAQHSTAAHANHFFLSFCLWCYTTVQPDN